MKKTITFLKQSLLKGKFLVGCLIFFGALFSPNSFSQASDINYTDSPFTFTPVPFFTPLTPTNSDSTVAAFSLRTVSTIRCTYNLCSSDGTDSANSFNNLQGIAVDQVGYKYVLDQENQSIRKISSG